MAPSADNPTKTTRRRSEKIVSNSAWYVRREGRGESSVIHVHDRLSGTIAFRMTQADARSLFDLLSKVTLVPPESSDGR